MCYFDEEKKIFFTELLKKTCRENGECIEWTGKTNQGYGTVYAFKTGWSVHRLSYMINKGEIPEGLYILHKCNNKKCFNINHLYAGTAKQNTEDYINSNYYLNVIKRSAETRKKNRLERESRSSIEIAEFLSVEQVAKIFLVDRKTIIRAINKGFIPAIRIGDGERSPYRISKKSIEHIHIKLVTSPSAKAEGFQGLDTQAIMPES